MTIEEIRTYQEIRLKEGLSPISDKQAYVEAEALINLIILTLKHSA